MATEAPPAALEQTDEEARAEAEAALEAERLAQQDAEADERAAKYAAEQAELDRSQPDRPEGAADDAATADTQPPEGEHFTTSSTEHTAPDEPTLAETLRQESGVASDHAEAKAEKEGELPGMPERKLTTNAGGTPPTVSEFKLAGRSIDLGAATQFKKGGATRLIIDVRWPEVDFIDKHDKETGQITDSIRRHKGTIEHYEIVAVDDEG